MNLIEKTAKAIYGNKAFANNFAPYEPEFFPIEKSVQMRDIEDRYSEFECQQLLEKFDWFRNLKKFQVKKVNVDITQMPGYEIQLNSKPVGFIERWSENRWRLGFCIVTDENEQGFKWAYFKKAFDSLDEAKQYLSIYYGKIQDRFKFYEEKIEQEIPEQKLNEDDEDF